MQEEKLCLCMYVYWTHFEFTSYKSSIHFYVFDEILSTYNVKDDFIIKVNVFAKAT